MKVSIRADGSHDIGLGHIMRCLSLAQALQAGGAQVQFLSRSSNAELATIFRGRGVDAVLLASTQGDERDDAADCAPALQAWRADLVVVDHYRLGACWHRTVRTLTAARLAAIDDLGDRLLEVDCLIDPNLTHDPATKFAGRTGPNTTLLAGPRYALLGANYASAPRHQHRCEVGSIGIFMGGTDAPNLTAMVHEICRRLVGYRGDIEIATTGSNPHLETLRRIAASDARTRLTIDQSDLAGFFARHDLHVGAGGGATWERCCIGAPTVALVTAPNQRQVLWPLRPLDLMVVVEGEPPDAEQVARAIRELIDQPTRRSALSSASRALVDGHGASRVADALWRLTS